jgi:glycosyltransferase involved in cell wall biosynthesis
MRVGGVPEVVEDGVSGFLVDPGDAPGLSNAVLRLLNDADRAREMGKKGRAIAGENYDINRVVARVEDVFSSLLERAGRPAGGRA